MSLTEFEELLQRYYEGTCSEKEKEWVDKWLEHTSLDRENRWQRLSSEERKTYVDDLYSTIEQSTGQRQPTKIRKIRRFWWAAAGCILFFIGYTVFQKTQTEVIQIEADSWLTLNTEPGSRKKITLIDGTVVWLQGGSILSYPSRFDTAERRVRLTGEGYFEVASNPDKPFVVQAGVLEAEVLGTSFNVKAYDELDQKIVSLVEGRLAVRARDSIGTLQQEVLLAAGEAAVFNHQGQGLEKSDLPVFDSAEDFKIGRLLFEETTMDRALFQIANAYGVAIKFDEKKARKHKITAVFSVNEPVDEVLRSIARSTGTRFVRVDQSRIEFTF